MQARGPRPPRRHLSRRGCDRCCQHSADHRRPADWCDTDVSGFATGLRTGLPEADLSSVVLLGAGGAGAAISHALLAAGVQRLAIVDLDRSRAIDRAASLLARYPDAAAIADTPDALVRLLPQATGLVNATFVGMHSHPGLPVRAELLRTDLWVADIVYRPLVTELVAAATALGAPVLDGGHMATGQAVDTFRLITGLEPMRPGCVPTFSS